MHAVMMLNINVYNLKASTRVTGREYWVKHDRNGQNNNRLNSWPRRNENEACLQTQSARPHNCAFAYLLIERLSASVNGLSSNSGKLRWQLEGWSEKVSRFLFLETYSRTSRHCAASLKMRELNLTTAARTKRPQFFARNLLRFRSQQLNCMETLHQNSERNKQALHRLHVAEAASLSSCVKCVKILTIGTSGSAAQSKPSAILHSSNNDVIRHVIQNRESQSHDFYALKSRKTSVCFQVY